MSQLSRLAKILSDANIDISHLVALTEYLEDENVVAMLETASFEDAVFAPKIVIGDGYVRAEALSGDAVIGDGCVTLSDIPACSFAAVTGYRD